MTFEYPYAGLILPDAQDLAPGPYLDSAARVLARLDPCGDHTAPTRRTTHRVTGHHLGISVFCEEQSDYGPRVTLEVVTVDGTPPDETDAARLLSDTVHETLDHCSADILEWYAPGALIDRDDFIRLRGYVSPRRMRHVAPETQDALFENAEAAQNICGTLYPKRPETDPETPDMPPAARTGWSSLRRIGQMAAATCALALLTSTGQVQLLFSQFLR